MEGPGRSAYWINTDVFCGINREKIDLVKLESLTLSPCRGMWGDDLGQLFDRLPSLTNLELQSAECICEELYSNYDCRTIGRTFLDRLCKAPKLQSIKLSSVTLDGKQAADASVEQRLMELAFFVSSHRNHFVRMCVAGFAFVNS